MDHLALVLSTVQQFVSEVGFSGDLKITGQHDPQANLYQVLIETNHPGSLIGYHGETLSALQLLVGQHLHSRLGEWLNLSINVNDYRQRREEALKSLADSAVSQVISTRTPHQLPLCPPASGV